MDRIESARKRLKGHQGRYPEIAKATRLNIEWVRKFAQGVIQEPSARKLERLENWLAKA